MKIPPFLLASIIPIAIAISPLPFNSQNRNSRTLEMRRQGIPKLVQLWDHFLRGFGPQNGPQNEPKIAQKINNFGVHFWIPFCWGFGAPWVPLGSRLGPPKALLGSLWTPKTLKNLGFFKVFANAGFWVLEALNGPLGLILAFSWADLVPKWPPKCSKSGPKNGPKNDPQKINF